MNVDESLVRSIVEDIVKNMTGEKREKLVPVGVSNRHIHLSREHLDILFGKGYELNLHKSLMGDEFASKELVTIIGPSLKSIENVRILGPVRKQSQVEISRTDTFTLKLNPPVRPSGVLNGSSPITIVGPNGVIKLAEGCIIANRHIHMTPRDSHEYGLQDGDYVDVLAQTDEKKTMFFDVQVRVGENYRLEMHIDTDDANAAALNNKSLVKLIKRT